MEARPLMQVLFPKIYAHVEAHIDRLARELFPQEELDIFAFIEEEIASDLVFKLVSLQFVPLDKEWGVSSALHMKYILRELVVIDRYNRIVIRNLLDIYSK